MVKLIMIDFDGVLVRSSDLWADALTKATKDAGIMREFSKENMKRHCGKSYEEVICEVTPEAREDEQSMCAIYKNLMKIADSDDFANSLEVIEGVREMLTKLNGRYRMALCSGNTRALLEKFVKKVGLDVFFEMLVAVDDVEKGKPDPEMLNKALDHFGIAPEEAVYVGDAESDVAAAKAAGVRSVVVLTGALDRHEAEVLEPDHIIESCSGLSAVLN